MSETLTGDSHHNPHQTPSTPHQSSSSSFLQVNVAKAEAAKGVQAAEHAAPATPARTETK